MAMIDRATLLALAARCEAAAGRDMQLGHDILVAVGKRHAAAVTCFGWPDSYADPTASLDAAMTLVPAGHDWCLGVGTDELANAAISPAMKAAEWHSDAATPALALTAAALRAIASQEPSA